MSFSASRCASLALCHVVVMDSCVKSEVTRLRRRACRWEDFRLRCRYFGAPPAIEGEVEVEVVAVRKDGGERGVGKNERSGLGWFGKK